MAADTPRQHARGRAPATRRAFLRFFALAPAPLLVAGCPGPSGGPPTAAPTDATAAAVGTNEPFTR